MIVDGYETDEDDRDVSGVNNDDKKMVEVV